MGSDAASEAVPPDADPDWPQVRAPQAGDAAALSELMRRHEAALFRFLCRNVPNAADAADLAQETFVRAYFKIHQFLLRAVQRLALPHRAQPPAGPRPEPRRAARRADVGASR